MEEKSKNRITVLILGEEYTIKGNSSPEEMQRAALLVDQLMKTLRGKNLQMSAHRVAVLAAINLADELLKLKEGGRDQGLLREEENSNELV